MTTLEHIESGAFSSSKTRGITLPMLMKALPERHQVRIEDLVKCYFTDAEYVWETYDIEGTPVTESFRIRR